ncbi:MULTISPECIES: hypothetical protein [unclassified Vibrio]|uniref:Lipoprotein n=1 Tax=Vibrio sp. HB236076 TaxID=3232307 RepID=A0AB39HFY8_9VIBR|nr:hypothetical protein [Vibrio sp. HB161653]MDP5254325.1 hypothetical protein [Vibrio sp. HB161653]
MKIKQLSLAVAAALLAGCGSDSDGSGETTTYEAPSVLSAIETPISVTIEDQDGQLLNATVTLIGDDASYVVETGSGEADSDDEYDAPDGLLLLTGQNIPDGVSSLSLKMVVSAPGYFSSSSDVAVDVDDNFSTTIVLASKNIDSTTVAIKSVSQEFETDDSGTVLETLTLTTEAADSDDENFAAMAGGSATVTIPSNTIVTDADGNPVTGTLTAAVNYFSNEPEGSGEATTSSLAAFPGGLDVETYIDENGDEVDADFSFASAGFVAIEISNEDGDVVKNFSNPTTISMQVPAATVNPDTGAVIATDDTIPMWSYDELTGQWSLEGTATVGALDSDTNTYTVSMDVDHLSYWNLDWYGARCSNNPLQISVLNSIGGQNSSPLAMKLQRSGYSKYRSSGYWGDNSQLTIYNPPNFSDLNIEFFVDGQSALTHVNGVSVGSDNTYTGSICDLHNGTITVDVAEPDYVEVDIANRTVCEQDTSIATQQPGYIYIRELGTSYYNAYRYWGYTQADSQLVQNLKQETDYYVYSYVYGQGYRSFTHTTGNAATESLNIDYPVTCEIAEEEVPTGSSSGSSGGDSGNTGA